MTDIQAMIDARFIMELTPIPSYIGEYQKMPADEWLAAEDGNYWVEEAVWATDTHISNMTAFDLKPRDATQVIMYGK